MTITDSQMNELKAVAPSARIITEGGYPFIHIACLQLPANCAPNTVEALLCVYPYHGYNSKLFFTEKITGTVSRNWNQSVRVLGKMWFAISWQTQPSLTPLQILMIQLQALYKK